MLIALDETLSPALYIFALTFLLALRWDESDISHQREQSKVRARPEGIEIYTLSNKPYLHFPVSLNLDNIGFLIWVVRKGHRTSELYQSTVENILVDYSIVSPREDVLE
jgi:hypothetical protein